MDLPLDEIQIRNFPLIFDGSQLTKGLDDPPGGLTLSHLEENGSVAVELTAGYKMAFRRIYTLGEKPMWEAQVNLLNAR